MCVYENLLELAGSSSAGGVIRNVSLFSRGGGGLPIF